MFETGVSGYLKLDGEISNNFPIDYNGVAHVTCSFCQYYSSQANKCRISGEIIYNAQKYIGQQCALNKGEE